MTLKRHLTDLAERLRYGCGPVIGSEEVQLWPKGRLEELIKLGVLAKGRSAQQITCIDCESEGKECSGIELTIQTVPETKETAAFFMCLEGGGLKRIPLERLEQYETVPEKLESLGYRTTPPAKLEDQLISLAEAGVMLGKIHRGTVGRMADRGIIRDNGLQGAERKISKLSVYEYLEMNRLRLKAEGYDNIIPDSEI